MASASSDSGETLTLNIMPMLDVFSILILFLLMSFSTDPVSHDITAGLELPESISIRSLDEIPMITITKKAIMVGDLLVTELENGEVPEKNRTQGAIAPLFKELEKLAEANRVRKDQPADVEGPQKDALSVEMDQTLSFKLLKRVMLTAQQADFVAFKLLVNKANDG
jgi:biopolymer transport protein ExbD